jgi:DNA-binding NarL/FixJ family response regulator
MNRTERATALELLIRAHASPGWAADRSRAGAAMEELRSIAVSAQTAPLLASASMSAGLIAIADGDILSARRELEDAVDLFDKSGAPFEAATARIALASTLQRLDRADAAVAELDRALDELTRLDARREIAAARALRDRMAGSKPGSAAARDTALTPREVEVLRLISSGLSNQAIADKLFISEHTVHRHVANTLSKLDVPSRSAAVAHAARLGLI